MTVDENALLIDYLREEGCSQREIEDVLKKLRSHDRRTMRESVFDSIASGNFNLQSIIKEVKADLNVVTPQANESAT